MADLVSNRKDQFMDVLDKALNKIVSKLTVSTLTDVYAGLEHEDMMFVEMAAKRLLEQYKEEAKDEIVRKCESEGLFLWLQQMDEKDMELYERSDLENKYCGSCIDVNKLLASQRMRMKKRLLRSMEKEILCMESELKDMYHKNKKSIHAIERGLECIKTTAV